MTKMTKIILTNDKDEHTQVSIQCNTRCVLCNKIKEKVIVCDNSEGDNNGVVFCLECCTKYLN